MYLKALEIQGFKSFPDKTVLTFGSDITGIVGPNGSGKSNISDAIRWVMGEMSSKALRGGKMEDVIFGGTLKRPQVGFAEVSLILDNTGGLFPLETAEVMVTRRYYRSGDSEYYINKESARLKDIVELFMDTGLGREGYSQVGQGRIDEIISVKSTDRREIFEEAAGISKYRHRKEESEKKLKNTDDNLTRINDKIAELELSVEPLREQAEKAKRYLILRDELRGLEITVWLDSLEKHRASAAQFMKDYESARDQSQALQTELDEMYSQSDKVTEMMRQCDTDAEELRVRSSQLEARAAELESSIAVAHTNRTNNETNLQRLKKDLDEQADRSGGISAQLEAKQSRIGEIDAEISVKENQREGIEREAAHNAQNSDDLAAKIDGLRAAASEKARQAQQMDSELAAVAGGVQQLYDRDTAIAQELSAIAGRKNEASQGLEKCLAALNDSRENAESLSNTIRGYELRLKSRNDKFNELNQKVTKLGLDRQSISGRINMLTEMERDYEGYSKAVRLVMAESEKGRLHNIFGPVSKLVKTEDELTVAIETALGASMQSIVVGSEEDGKSAIELLKRRDGGRATFLPVTSVKGNRLNENGLERQQGFVGIASDLVSFEPRFEGIFKSLLGRTVIARDMDSAIAIARKFSHRFRIVTVDGQVLNAGGSMTGGSSSKNSGILSRANELKRLKTQLEGIEKDAAAQQKLADEAKRQVVQVEYELSVARDELRTAQDESLKLEGEKGQYQLLLNSLEASEQSLRAEKGSLKDKLSDSNEKIEACRTESSSLRAQAEEMENQAAELGKDASQLDAQTRNLTDKLAAIRTEQAALEAEKTALLAGIQELEQLRQVITGDRKQNLDTVTALEAQNDVLNQSINALTQELGQVNTSLGQVKDQLKLMIDKKLELEGQRTKLDRVAQEKNRELLLAERETARLEQKKSASEMEEKQIADRLWDNYELTITDAQSLRQDISTSKANRRISEIKKESAALGTPNIGAIEEFDRVNTRYEFLTGQRDDVLSAKADLERIIKDITSEMKVIFAEQFQRINESFKVTFAEIFGGGSGQLILEDEEDILGCGIEIKVQPPGKSVKNITLLSGGEKAFVAIALYFAILKVSPTPFCVLDEIDAALDDNNVVRYARYLRKLSDKTQFIVITHRRGTMEEADVLYGVTMQEQGVSKILTLDLNKMSAELNIK